MPAAEPAQSPEEVRSRLEEFTRRGSAPLYGFLLRVTGDPELARDLLQETLLEALKHLERYDSRLPLKNWLFRIGQNRLRNCLRRRRLERKWMEPLAGDPVAPGRDVEANAGGEQLERALLRLPHVQRIAVLLRYREELTCAEIGAVLDMTPNAVSIQLHRARRALRSLLGEGTGG